MGFKQCLRAHNFGAIQLHVNNAKLGKITTLKVVFHVVTLVYQLFLIKFLARPCNGLNKDNGLCSLTHLSCSTE